MGKPPINNNSIILFQTPIIIHITHPPNVFLNNGYDDVVHY